MKIAFGAEHAGYEMKEALKAYCSLKWRLCPEKGN